jgi:hypothetical protein
MATIPDKSAGSGPHNSHLMEAQSMEGNGIEYGYNTAQRKRNTLRDSVLLLLLTTVLAILIAAMVGVFQSKSSSK